MVGLQTLDLAIGVRVPASQLKMLNKLAETARSWNFRLRALSLESGLFRLIQSQHGCNLDKIPS
jgi:hypothetical protein